MNAKGARRGLRAMTSAAVLVALTGNAMADFTYADFSNPSALNMLGNAVIQGDGEFATLGLSSGRDQISSTWHTERQNIADAWTSEFTFSISNLTNSGADGFAFVVQNASVDMHEDNGFGRGGGLGYNMGSNLLAVEFDTWRNGPAEDPNANHISIQNAGPGITSSHQNDSLGVTGDILNLSSGDLIDVLVSYEPGTMRIALNGEQVLEAAVDLSTALDSDGTAWVGFTAATGGDVYQAMDIHSWNFDGAPIPAPSSLALLGLGLAGMSRRRR